MCRMGDSFVIGIVALAIGFISGWFISGWWRDKSVIDTCGEMQAEISRLHELVDQLEAKKANV